MKRRPRKALRRDELMESQALEILRLQERAQRWRAIAQALMSELNGLLDGRAAE
jgi:hypothetical protein